MGNRHFQLLSYSFCVSLTHTHTHISYQCEGVQVEADLLVGKLGASWVEGNFPNRIGERVGLDCNFVTIRQ